LCQFRSYSRPKKRRSHAGNKLYAHILAKHRKGQNTALVKKIINSFERRPSGLVLPGNQLIRRLDGNRIKRVAWKIVRGLHFHRTNKVLPENLTVSVTLTNPESEPPKHFIAFRDLPGNNELGDYPGISATDSRFLPRHKMRSIEPCSFGIVLFSP
jgi:hypothetical protein